MTRRGSSPNFVGRRAELDRLDDAYARAVVGRPSLILVAGEAGIGKTRLISEFEGAIERAGGIAISGGCLDLGEGGLPYAPFVEAFRALSRRLDTETKASVFASSADAIAPLLPDLQEREAGSTTDPSGRLARLFDAVITVLGRASAHRPLVVVIEDIHWADGSTRDMIRFLVRNLSTERLVMVATYRTDDLHRRHPVMPLLAELGRADRVERVELERFGRDELAEQLGGILGEVPTPERVEALLERSDGLPFYVEELAAGIDHDGAALPSSIRDILDLRLATLSPGSLSVVRASSVIGGRWPHARLATLTDLEEPALIAALREATDAGILVSLDGHMGPVYAFRHALLREAAYEDLLPAERARLHGRLADELNRSITDEATSDPAVFADIAVHAYHAHDLPRALEASVGALRAFSDAVAYREALAHGERALELWPLVDGASARAGVDHAALCGLVGRAAAAASRPERATTLLQEALGELDTPGDADERVSLLADLQMSAWEAREFDVSRDAAEQAHALGFPGGATRLKAYVLWMLGVSRWWDGRLRESAGLLEEALAVAEAVGDRAFWADAEAALAHTLSDMGLGERARTLLDASRAAVPEGDRRYDRVAAETDRSVTATTCGRYVDAEQSARLGLELATRYGWEPRLGSHFRSCIVDALFELGRYDEAEPLARPVLAGAGIHHSINWMASTMARVAVAQGRFEEAHRLIDDIAPTWFAWGEDSFSIISRIDLARAEGRFEEVRSVGDQAMEIIVTSDVKSAAIALLGLAIGAAADSASLSRRRRRVTDVAEAADAAKRWIEALESTVSRARTEGGAGALNEAILATANAEMGRVRDAPVPEAWAAAVDHWVALAHPFQTAYARLRYAEALLENGQDRPAAEDALRSGHAVAASIGATPLREAIESVARDARVDIGVTAAERPDSVTDEPRLTLTKRERDVLRLVAAGHTNREIGDQLYISEKTVSVHVSNAMAKLGALSRYEAAASAQGLGLL